MFVLVNPSGVCRIECVGSRFEIKGEQRMDSICSGSEMNFRIVFFYLIVLVNPTNGSRMDSICFWSEMNCRIVFFFLYLFDFVNSAGGTGSI